MDVRGAANKTTICNRASISDETQYGVVMGSKAGRRCALFEIFTNLGAFLIHFFILIKNIVLNHHVCFHIVLFYIMHPWTSKTFMF